MKKIILIALLAFGMNANAQTYDRLLGNSNLWNVSGGFEGCFTLNSFIKGDTTILTNTYSKLYCPWCETTGDTVLVALLREDTTQKKVFMRRINYPNILDSNEFVYYDFSLTVGDTIFLYQPNIFNQEWSFLLATPFDFYIVDSVTTTPTMSGIKRVTYLRKKNPTSDPFENHMIWVEGVGIVEGLYIDFCDGCSMYLDCEFKDGIQQFDGSYNYLQPDYTCYCNSTISINEISHKKDLINIYPNPATDNLTIDVSASLNIPAIIEITNIQGQLLETLATTGNKTTIDISALAKGMYFVKVKTEKGVAVRKFIKE